MKKVEQNVNVGVGVMVKSGTQILLGKRKANKEKNTSWTFPGGQLDYGESLFEAAAREVKEETGIVVNDLSVAGIVDDFDGAGHSHWVTVNFVCENFSGEAEIKEPDKFSKWEWFELDDPPENLFRPAQGTIDAYHSDEMYVRE